MTTHSITSSQTFQSRLVRAEIQRAWLMVGAFGIALIIMVVRRLTGDIVAGVDALFISSILVTLACIAFEIFAAAWWRRAMSRGSGAPAWMSSVSATVELGTIVVLLAMFQAMSPRGNYVALSGPTAFGLPLVVMMSIPRLRPRLCLVVGVCAALCHWALVAYAITVAKIDASHWPVLLTYGLWLVMMGIGARMIANHARSSMIEAVQEAHLAERTERALAVVERDLTVAQEIQAGLMPATSPTIAGYDIAGFARPAAKAGGDYYDWQPMPDGRFVVAMADVTGHGIGPALVMAVCRSYGRATAPNAPNPSVLLSSINALIYEDLSRTGRFITMAIAILSPDGTIELASAGHGPTLVYRAASNEVEVFGGDGLPLGVIEDEAYGPHRTITLERNDVLLLLTDGFMEWHGGPEKKIFGIDRLKDALRNGASGHAKSVIEKLDAAVQAYAAGVEQEDDTTAVAVKRV